MDWGVRAMQVGDMRRQLATGELRGIENAFRALLGQGRGVQGASSLDELMHVLQAACNALAYDDRPMPRDLASKILADTGLGFEERSYAVGSRAVQAHRAQWREMLGRHVPTLADGIADPMTEPSRGSTPT